MQLPQTLRRETSEVLGGTGVPSCSACTNETGTDLNGSIVKLKIGIPKKVGFTEFVKVHKDPKTKKTCATGFSIEVFCAALQLLPFKVEPVFYSFEKENGESAGTYNELVHNITVKQFDAVVGDLTIMANRASWVDFTMSYVDSSVYVLVPIKHDTRKNIWTFLQPFNRELWLAIFMASISLGILIGIIEMRSDVTNTDFEGPLLQQLGMMIWYPVSMFVLPERSMVISRWSKLVLVVWLYTSYVILQSYTANLTTMLTIDQLRPFFNKKGNYSIGFQSESFVEDYLKQQNFTRLRSYSTIEEYHKALSNGSVAAIFDELPYVKLFLREHGSEYTVLDGPKLRTNGFGFAFPMNSSLVPPTSRAIMSVTDGGKMDEIEHKYLGRKDTSEVESSRLAKETTCLDIKETPSLDAYNFIGIFIVAGIISIASFICSEIQRQFVKRVSSTKKINVVEDLPNIDNQNELQPTTSNENVEIVYMREEGEQEDEGGGEQEDEGGGEGHSAYHGVLNG
ncbi:glutamate receptor 2.8-like isoform X2 [Cornus florida]|uniref:glutamate receptor 2.8-like isoform X2 n=1 Tax=Cornus florida TaxID=4283 RepID=UPI00289F58BE|nr:glutamate receptor 2.8-like isoform X2 [Cornus florida]